MPPLRDGRPPLLLRRTWLFKGAEKPVSDQGMKMPEDWRDSHAAMLREDQRGVNGAFWQGLYPGKIEMDAESLLNSRSEDIINDDASLP